MESIQVHDKTFVPYLKDAEIQEIVKATALKIYEDYKKLSAKEKVARIHKEAKDAEKRLGLNLRMASHII